ncbi:hypothetical protein D3C77_429770 [compost metagenome]
MDPAGQAGRQRCLRPEPQGGEREAGADPESLLLGSRPYGADPGHLRPHQSGECRHQPLSGGGSAHHRILPQGAVPQADEADPGGGLYPGAARHLLLRLQHPAGPPERRAGASGALLRHRPGAHRRQGAGHRGKTRLPLHPGRDRRLRPQAQPALHQQPAGAGREGQGAADRGGLWPGQAPQAHPALQHG